MYYWIAPSYELYHHGIKGMRWGIRRFQNENGSLKPAGEKRYYGHESQKTKKGSTTSVSSAGSNSKKKGLTDKQKKALKITAAVAGTVLAAYGAYKVSKIIKNNSRSKSLSVVANHKSESIQDLVSKYGDVANMAEIPKAEIPRVSIPKTEIPRTTVNKIEIPKTEVSRIKTFVQKQDLPGGGNSTIRMTQIHSPSFNSKSSIGEQSFESLIKQNRDLFDSTLKELGF